MNSNHFSFKIILYLIVNSAKTGNKKAMQEVIEIQKIYTTGSNEIKQNNKTK